jgi:Predicted flavoprotein
MGNAGTHSIRALNKGERHGYRADGCRHDALQGGVLRREPGDRIHQSPACEGARPIGAAGARDDGDPFNDLPLYSYDYDKNYPPVATTFKNAIASVDAVLFVTPEYNRSIPGALKNAIDRASRPWGANSLARKPSASSTCGAFCNSPLMNAIEAYIEFTPGLLSDDNEVTVD